MKPHPKTVRTQATVKKVKSLILKEHSPTQRFIASKQEIPFGTRASRKTVTSEHKAFRVLRFAKTESAITVQRVFRIKVPPFGNFQTIITFVDGIISLKQINVFVKGKVRDDQGLA
ncbi:hypothetical protein TNCV_152881 [Trichonephila clavipes]|nr:hypothetical protein TNCV_152881 [Trichonephila clavipes]